MNIYLYCGNPKSEGGKELAEMLGAKRIRHTGSTYVPQKGDVVINWGAVSIPNFSPAKVVNADLSVSSNKLSFFQAMDEVTTLHITPWYCELKGYAEDILKTSGGAIVCRTILNGSGGKGIVIAKDPSELVDAPLYVKYVNKEDEYRIHIMAGEVIDIQKKARKLDVPNPNWEVRNLAGGFIYKRKDIHPPESVIGVAKECMAHLPLNFGAVDVVWTGNRAYVLEVNSAPGLEGQTIKLYAEAFKKHFVTV